MDKKIDVQSNSISKKRKRNFVRFIISLILIIGLGYVVFNYVPFIAKYDHYVIRTGSMDPVIKIGDLVFIDTSKTPDELNEGDIIAFRADINDDGVKDVVVHYLFSRETIDGVTYYRTKPEISDSLDDWTLVDSDIIGLETFKIPKIGPAIMFTQSTIGKVFLITDIIIIYLLVEYFNYDKKKQNKPEEYNIDETKDTK